MIFLRFTASSPEPRQCPYIGKFTVTTFNHASSRNSRQSGHKNHQQDDRDAPIPDRLRHSGQQQASTAIDEQQRRGSRRLEPDKKRGNNQYLLHEPYNRRVREMPTTNTNDDHERIATFGQWQLSIDGNDNGERPL